MNGYIHVRLNWYGWEDFFLYSSATMKQEASQVRRGWFEVTAVTCLVIFHHLNQKADLITFYRWVTSNHALRMLESVQSRFMILSSISKLVSKATGQGGRQVFSQLIIPIYLSLYLNAIVPHVRLQSDRREKERKYQLAVVQLRNCSSVAP